MRYKIGLLVPAIFFVSACDIGNHPEKDPNRGQKLACEIPKVVDPHRREITDRLPIQRIFELHKFLDCKGQVTREEWVTIKDPKNTYIISAQFTGYAGAPLQRTALSRTTCYEGTFKEAAESADRIMSLRLTTSPGTDRMRVLKDKKNEIDFEFSYCANPAYGPISTCKKVAVGERGTLWLTIDYTETYLPNAKIVPAENCPVDLI